LGLTLARSNSVLGDLRRRRVRCPVCGNVDISVPYRSDTVAYFACVVCPAVWPIEISEATTATLGQLARLQAHASDLAGSTRGSARPASGRVPPNTQTRPRGNARGESPNRRGQATVRTREAVHVHRKLADAEPIYREDLSKLLGSLAFHLSRQGDASLDMCAARPRRSGAPWRQDSQACFNINSKGRRLD
jgi:hypothetical protein